MKLYARIQDRFVVELLSTDLEITGRFNPALVWIDVSHVIGIMPGWQQSADSFSAPPPPPIPTVPTLAQLQAQLAIISDQIAALSKAR